MQSNTNPIELVAPRGDADWAMIESLYIELFPPDERRAFSLVKKFHYEKTCFNVLVILFEGKAVGFFTTWEFDRFFYGEHFAVDQTLANKGIGSRVLTLLGEQLRHKPIYLEVEPPVDEITTRRVGFYQRNGFELIDRLYIQPPYSPDSHSLEMRLMVRGTSDVPYEEVEKTIHFEVYGKREEN